MPGRIHVSEQFRGLAGAAFTFEDRGSTEIKSIGATRTFLLLGEAAPVRRKLGGRHFRNQDDRDRFLRYRGS